MMQNLDIASILFLLLGAVAAIAVIYYSLEIAREWLGQWNHTTNDTIRRAVVHDSFSMRTSLPNGLTAASD
jgi:hypothetical protein